MGEVIELFADRRPPPTIDSEFWEWGREYVEDGVNNLDYIVASVKNAENEQQLLAALQELKDEVGRIPGLT